jgi:DNA-binding transcriptional LysR family regulator
VPSRSGAPSGFEFQVAMTLDQLRTFIAVAEREHVTRAAESLNVTQSAVSATIASLERELGTKLFNRIGRGIAMTEAGHLLLGEARAILDRVQSATLAVRELSDLRRGRITIKASQTIANHFLPQKLFRFHEMHPGITLEVLIGNSAEVARAVTNGEVELGLIEDELSESEARILVAEKVAEDRLAIVVAASHPWARKRMPTARELAAATWVVREEGSGTRAMLGRYLAAHGVDAKSITIALELPSNEAVLSAVMAGSGITILSESVCVDSIEIGRVARLAADLDVRPFYVVQHADRYRSRAVAALLEVMRESRLVTAKARRQA